ncbi:MAG: lipase [Synechococcales cyanobacterium]
MVRPSVIIPGYFATASEYLDVQADLERQGYPTAIVPVQVSNWLVTVGGRPVTPILRLIDQTVQTVRERYGSDQVNLIGHSAGGWIARIYLGSHPYDGQRWHRQEQVSTLISLGTPHRSREPWTKNNLGFVNNHYPGAFCPQVKYVCLAGKGLFGQPFDWQRWNVGEWFAYTSYELTDGQGSVWGDGITPIPAAHLDGATNLVFEQVMHSPRGNRLWYGSPTILPQWLNYLD